MLSENRRFTIPTSDGSSLEAEVNFSDSEEVKNAKTVRLHRGDEFFDVKSDDLIAFLFLIGDENTAEKLTPFKQKKIRKLEKLLAFEWTATRDYKKGDRIAVKAPYIETIEDSEEMMANAVKNALDKGKSFKINHNFI